MPSLRATLLVGVSLLVVPLVLGLTGIVYVRARDHAERALHDRVRVRAENLAGLLECDHGRVELEVPYAALPEYARPEGGVFFTIYDAAGRVFASSPSLGEESLPPPPAWSEGNVVLGNLEAGPHGRPCVILALSTLVRIDEEGASPDEEGHGPPLSVERRRFRVQVALDRSESDRELASLATFLALLGGSATLLALLGAALLARRLLRPIHAMADRADSLTPDDPGRRLEPDRVVRELHGLAVKLNEAFDRLDEALRQQRRFTADASHELRTPTAILLANAELMLRRERSAEGYREGLERQRTTARRMATLVDDLLALARADSGNGVVAREPVDLVTVVRSVGEEQAPVAEEKGLELTLDLADAAPLTGDADRLAQLVANLLANALRHAASRVEIRVRADGDVVLEVRDDGPGIAEEHHPHLFERFYRVDAERSGEQGGTGLGLAIVAWIADAHGGTVGVESVPGEGATFRVELPRADRVS
jgi:heavy metal sensor kinase